MNRRDNACTVATGSGEHLVMPALLDAPAGPHPPASALVAIAALNGEEIARSAPLEPCRAEIGDSRLGARAGFSLVEALVALAISAAIFAAIGRISAAALHDWGRGQGAIVAMEMLTRGLNRLAADLAAALPVRPPGSENSGVLFRGDANGLLFVAATGIGSGLRGVELISVSSVAEEQGTTLVRRRGPVAGMGNRLEDPVPLLSGRLVVRFAYVDRTGQRLAAWSGRPELPALVEAEIYGADGRPVFPVPVVLPIASSVDPQCLGGAAIKEGERPRGCGPAKPGAPASQDEPEEDEE